MRFTAFIFLLPLLFLSCEQNDGTDLYSLDWSLVYKIVLPEEYLEILDRCDSLNSFEGDYYFTTKDEVVISSNPPSFFSWNKRHVLTIDGKVFYMECEEEIGPPFFLHKKDLYFQIPNYEITSSYGALNYPKGAVITAYGIFDLWDELDY